MKDDDKCVSHSVTTSQVITHRGGILNSLVNKTMLSLCRQNVITSGSKWENELCGSWQPVIGL